MSLEVRFIISVMNVFCFLVKIELKQAYYTKEPWSMQSCHCNGSSNSGKELTCFDLYLKEELYLFVKIRRALSNQVKS